MTDEREEGAAGAEIIAFPHPPQEAEMDDDERDEIEALLNAALLPLDEDDRCELMADLEDALLRTDATDLATETEEMLADLEEWEP